ncbi:MAG: SDR family NAD(P)-dependent oxidoreductase [Deltaproteobacteria bacterium]|nr:SDR family NAD(P)-dependent oxidoreductase [Deltaproteobacteria bacterium]
MENIRGKTALLTGGSRGLGVHIAGFLAKEGVNLALTARSEEGLKTTADEVSRENVKVKIYPADITDQASREKLIKDVKADFGQIDLLINNAGMICWPGAAVILSPCLPLQGKGGIPMEVSIVRLKRD